MREKLIIIASLIIGFMAPLGCVSSQTEQFSKFGMKEFNSLRLGVDTTKSVSSRLGLPSESRPTQWVYHLRKVPKLWLVFENDVLSSASWSIWDEDAVNQVETLLREFHAEWTVIKEPMTNPHTAPNLCYLEDLKNGRRVEVNGFKRKISELTIWRPQATDKSAKNRLSQNLSKEFCIGGLCSKVTEASAWEHNHCDWLERLVSGKPF